MSETLSVDALPSSFVARRLKFEQDRGAGEAKLHVGPLKSETQYDDFFEFGSNIEYKFERGNLLDYLLQVKLEYIYQVIFSYKDIDLDYWNEIYKEISGLSNNDLMCSLEKFTDKSRYYLRANENVFKNYFRGIALPRLTNVKFEKSTLSSGRKEIIIKLELNPNCEAKKDVINYRTEYESEFARNRIIFGAPGTGKSYSINQDKDELLSSGGDFERVTFHPDYFYANFVGTYKPVPFIDGKDEDSITYEYVPGPFMRVYVKALKNGRTNNIKPHLLIIEEINRANAAAVFGEIFQLLDRDSSNVSEYSVQPSEDIKKYLADELGEKIEDISTLKIPDNMFIWATMNSADQGVFPLDTAFKRRWDFDYLGINNNENDIKGYTVSLGKGEYTRPVEWNELRKSINDALSSYKINEDKLLGPYFLARKIVVPNEGNDIDAEKFISAFKSKVLMYLFEDAAKQRRLLLFDGCSDTTKYSSICEEFDLRGVEIFCKSIRGKFPRAVSMVAESPGEYE